MRRQLTRTLLTGVSLLALSSLLLSLPKRAAMTTPAQASESPNSVISSTPDREARMRVSEAYGKLPLSFEENRGQADRQVRFLSRGPNYALLLTPSEAVLSLQSEKPANANSERTQTEKHETQTAVLRMKLAGANQSPTITGGDQLTGKSNYLIGDQAKWHTNIPNYAKVQYDEVYPGIDLVYYGNQRRLEYDFVVAPGADPSGIRLSFDGADELNLDADGSLRLKLNGGEVTQPAPVIYQRTASGERQRLAGHYVLKGEREVIFEVADYDRSRELVIDPQLLYATFYGGSDFDTGDGIAVDGSGNAYITGTTLSSGLTLKNAYDGNFSGGGGDAFVMKLNPTGTDIVYATYLGGSITSEGGDAIAITSDGRACVTGSVNSVEHNSDFPITSNAYQGNPSIFNPHGVNAFVTVIAPGGNGLVYSTFFGGSFASSPIDAANGIAVDAANKIYITGEATTSNFPTKNAFQNSKGGTRDAFIAKFDVTQSGNNSLIYSSYLGGSGTEFGRAIAVTPAGVAFVVGVTGSFNFPTKSSSSLPVFQTTQGGVNDSFIAKVSPSGALIYATYFGGNDRDEAQSVAVDSEERAYVTGFTLSSALTFPLKNAFQPNRIGSSQDAFVAKFNADGTALFYSSFLGGGTTNNTGTGIAVDAGGNAYVTGFSVVFNNALTVNGFPSSVPALGGLVAKIEASDAAGTTIPKILYMDGFSTAGNGIAVDPRGNVYIVGTNSGAMPATPGAFQATFNGGTSDATVAKIGSTFPDTIGVFHPPGGVRPLNDFRLRNSNTAGPSDLTEDFGETGDQALAGDWNGDGLDDVGVYRPSTAQFLLHQPIRLPIGGVIEITITINFGLVGDKPVVGDWDGNGTDTPGVFRNGQFLLTNAANTNGSTPPPDLNFTFGQPADSPVAGDWNADGIDSIGTFNAGSWALRNANSSGAPDITVLFGTAVGARPVVGDWNGDGVDTIGVFLPSSVFGTPTFGLNNANANVTGLFDILAAFGADGDLPISGEWDGKPANTPPNSGVNNPAEGFSRAEQTQVFTTTCSDPDGWHDLRKIDFKIAQTRKAGRAGDDHDESSRAKDDWRDKEEKNQDRAEDGSSLIFWVRFDENRNVVRFYDPELRTWLEGAPGSNIVLESDYARLYLSGTSVLGTGPLGPSVQITWTVVFKEAAKGNYKQFLKITDDTGSSTGFDRVGSWKVKH